MKLRRINESFKVMAESILAETASRDELRIALMNEVDRLMSQGAMIKAFEIAFQDVIERFYPDKCWWEVCDLNIFWDLMESRDPEETVQHILDNMKVEESAPINEEMDTFYGNLCREMDADNENMYQIYKQGDTAPADALVSLGYYAEGEHLLVQEIENDGIQYKKVFDFTDFDFGDPYYGYYVLKDGVIPSGWTSTFSTLDESLVETLQQLVSKLNESEMSDEDRHDSDLIRSMIQKMQVRSNAAFTPEEKAVMKKYGITRDNYRKQLTVADRALNPDIDSDSREYHFSRSYSNGTPAKINYADRARKLPARKDSQIAGDGSRWYVQNQQYNNHRDPRSLVDVDNAIRSDKMHEPYRDMEYALASRNNAQRRIDNAESERARRMNAAQAAFDKAKRYADWHYDRDTVDSAKSRDAAQDKINTLLKRKTEAVDNSYAEKKRAAFLRKQAQKD